MAGAADRTDVGAQPRELAVCGGLGKDSGPCRRGGRPERRLRTDATGANHSRGRGARCFRELLPRDLLRPKPRLAEQRRDLSLHWFPHASRRACRPGRESKIRRHRRDALGPSAVFHRRAPRHFPRPRTPALEPRKLLRRAAPRPGPVHDRRPAALDSTRRRWRGLGVGREVRPRENPLRLRDRPARPRGGRAARHRGGAGGLGGVHGLLRLPLQSRRDLQPQLRAVDSAGLARNRARRGLARRRAVERAAPRGELDGAEQRHREGSQHAHRRAQRDRRSRPRPPARKLDGAGAEARRGRRRPAHFRAPQRAVLAGLSRRPEPLMDGLQGPARLPDSARAFPRALRRSVLPADH